MKENIYFKTKKVQKAEYVFLYVWKIRLTFCFENRWCWKYSNAAQWFFGMLFTIWYITIFLWLTRQRILIKIKEYIVLRITSIANKSTILCLSMYSYACIRFFKKIIICTQSLKKSISVLLIFDTGISWYMEEKQGLL